MPILTPGTLPPDILVFLAQGTIDPIIKPEVTQDYAAKLCKAGSKVETLALPNVGHGWAGRAAAPYAVDWMTARFGAIPRPTIAGSRAGAPSSRELGDSTRRR